MTHTYLNYSIAIMTTFTQRDFELLEKFRAQTIINARESGFSGETLLAVEIAVAGFSQDLLMDLAAVPTPAPVTPPTTPPPSGDVYNA
jgi:hypothetical protein